MPQKSPDENKTRAIPVSAIYFGQVVKWPDLGGAGSCIKVDKPGVFRPAANIIVVDSIFEYGDKFVINGQYYMRTDCSYILCYEY